MTEPRFVRCLSGHPFDAAQHEVCPECGSPAMASRKEATRKESARKDPAKDTLKNEKDEEQGGEDEGGGKRKHNNDTDKRRLLMTVGGGALALLVVVGGFVLYDHFDRPELKKDDKKTAASAAEASTDTGTNTDTGNGTGTNTGGIEISKDVDLTQLPEQLRNGIETTNDPRVVEFLKADEAELAPLRPLLAPVDPADAMKAFDVRSKSAAAEKGLHFSLALRLAIANRRAYRLFSNNDIDNARAIFEALTNEPAEGAWGPNSYAHYMLGMIYWRFPRGNPEKGVGALQVRYAAEQGLTLAIEALGDEDGMAKAAGLSTTELNDLLTLGMSEGSQEIQHMMEARMIDVVPPKQISDAIDAAVGVGKWPAILDAYEAYKGKTPIGVDNYMSTWIFYVVPNTTAPMDRGVVLATRGALGEYWRSFEGLSQVTRDGVGGVTADKANSAGWYLLLLLRAFEVDPKDPFIKDWIKRYQELRAGLSNDQRTMLDQIGNEFGFAP